MAVEIARTELAAALLDLKSTRSASRSRSDTDAQRRRVTDARKAKGEATRAWRARRAAILADDASRLACDAINARAHELTISARAHCGVYWGTYLLVEDAAQAARKAPLYDGDEPSDPLFAPWRGEGNLGVQVQGGEPVAAIVGTTDTRVRIGAVDPRAHLRETPHGERKRMCRTTLRLRVGSEGRDPIWAEWPMILHRPMPPEARVKRVVVSLHRIGSRERWSRECGGIDEYDAAVEVQHTCTGCGVMWDQDVNAARGMIERWRVGQKAGTARSGETVAKSETRWERAARLRAEKEVRQETARKLAANDAE